MADTLVETKLLLPRSRRERNVLQHRHAGLVPEHDPLQAHLAVHLAMRLVLRTIAFGNIASVTVLITVGLRLKFPARFDRGFACGDILVFRGQIAGLPDRDVLDAVRCLSVRVCVIRSAQLIAAIAASIVCTCSPRSITKVCGARTVSSALTVIVMANRSSKLRRCARF